MKLTKLSIEEKLEGGRNRYIIPSTAKVYFGSRGCVIRNFTDEQIKTVFGFSYNQASKLNQKEGWYQSDESEKRKSYEMFVDTFNGKMGEEVAVFYEYANGKAHDL